MKWSLTQPSGGGCSKYEIEKSLCFM